MIFLFIMTGVLFFSGLSWLVELLFWGVNIRHYTGMKALKCLTSSEYTSNFIPLSLWLKPNSVSKPGTGFYWKLILTVTIRTGFSVLKLIKITNAWINYIICYGHQFFIFYFQKLTLFSKSWSPKTHRNMSVLEFLQNIWMRTFSRDHYQLVLHRCMSLYVVVWLLRHWMNAASFASSTLSEHSL